MSMVIGKPGFAAAVALALVSLCFAAQSAHAQGSPVPYWTTAWPAGFGSNFTAAQGSNSFSSLSSALDGTGGVGSFSSRYDLPNGWFVGSERGGMALNGFGSAWSNLPSLSYEGTQMGYNFKDAAVPVSVYAGFGTLKYNNAFAPPPLPGFDSMSSSSSPGYAAHVGVEFRPTSNLSLSVGASFSQQPNDLNSQLLPGASPFGYRGR